MPKRLQLKPDGNGRIQFDLTLSEWVSATSFDEVSFDISGWTYATVQVVGRTALSWGSGSIDVKRSNNGVDALDFGSAVTFTGVGISALLDITANGYLHVMVDSSATPTTATGTVTICVQLSKT